MVRETSQGEYSYDYGSDPYVSYNSDTNQITAVFSPSTILFPRKKDEPLAWAVFSFPRGLNFSFYAKGRTVKEREMPDLRFHLKPESRFLLDYRADQKVLLIKLNNLWVDQKQPENAWENNGRIISWEDLSGAQMFVTFSERKTDDAQLLEQMNKADGAATLGSIRLQISQRTYCISKGELKKVSDAYTYTFPDDLETGECRW
jgi:hypothetical protein